MSKEQLDHARELIIEGQFDEARTILTPLADISTTAQKWLAHLDEVAPVEPVEGQDDTDEDFVIAPDEADTSAFAREMNVFEESDETGLMPDEDTVEIVTTAARSRAFEGDMDTQPALDVDAAPTVHPEPRPVPDQMFIPADETQSPTAAADAHEMPIDETAHLLPVDDGDVPAGAGMRWEYREIVLKNWHQHVSNIEYALEQGGEKITIEDAYTQLLNESGAQGWEVISEEVLPQQYIRLLLKRPVRQ